MGGGFRALKDGVGAGKVGSSLGKFLGGTGFASTVVRSVVTNVLTQGVGVATGLQDKFSWSGVAASAVGGAIGYGGEKYGLDPIVTRGASLLAEAATRSLIDGTDFGDNIIAALPDVIAQTVMDVAGRLDHKDKSGAAKDDKRPSAQVIDRSLAILDAQLKLELSSQLADLYDDSWSDLKARLDLAAHARAISGAWRSKEALGDGEIVVVGNKSLTAAQLRAGKRKADLAAAEAASRPSVWSQHSAEGPHFQLGDSGIPLTRTINGWIRSDGVEVTAAAFANTYGISGSLWHDTGGLDNPQNQAAIGSQLAGELAADPLNAWHDLANLKALAEAAYPDGQLIVPQLRAILEPLVQGQIAFDQAHPIASTAIGTWNFIGEGGGEVAGGIIDLAANLVLGIPFDVYQATGGEDLGSSAPSFTGLAMGLYDITSAASNYQMQVQYGLRNPLRDGLDLLQSGSGAALGYYGNVKNDYDHYGLRGAFGLHAGEVARATGTVASLAFGANAIKGINVAAKAGKLEAAFAAERGGVDLALTYKPGWTAAQRAEANLKVKILTEGDTVVSQSTRSGTSAASRYRSAGNQIPAGNDIDHAIDLQLGGLDTVSNIWPLNSSVNRSLGAQIQQQIKNLPEGTVINQVTIGNR